MNDSCCKRRARLYLAAMLGAALLIPLTGYAQSVFPNRVIKVIVPVAPGGGADAVARMLTEKMSQSLGTPIIIENKGGACGSIAAMSRARCTCSFTFFASQHGAAVSLASYGFTRSGSIDL